jgi:hypothetical protein
MGINLSSPISEPHIAAVTENDTTESPADVAETIPTSASEGVSSDELVSTPTASDAPLHTSPSPSTSQSPSPPVDLALPKSPELKFHADYSASKGIILQSTDDGLFGFHLDILTKHSTIFEDLCHVPCESPAETGHDPVVPVPIASVALKYVLDTGSAVEHGFPTPNMDPQSAVHWKEVITFMHMFECASMFPWFTDEVPVTFTIAVIVGDEGTVDELFPRLISLKSKPFESPKWWTSTLLMSYPSVYQQICGMSYLWGLSNKTLRNKLQRLGAFKAFGNKCCHPNGKRPCREYINSSGDFESFRNHYIPRLGKRIESGELLVSMGVLSWSAIRAIVTDLKVLCKRCGNRFTDDVMRCAEDWDPAGRLPCPLDKTKWRIQLPANVA